MGNQKITQNQKKLPLKGATEIDGALSIKWANGINFTNTPNDTVWRWTPNGEYSARSAYAIQLKGSYCTFEAQAIWKARMEGKHRFFA
uniref:Uncharacterized protein n=1 Tax=Setaria viridis TaxID=4556 RepID=A0A4U6TP06_SETVI|nr:hypothetical protein SEVIR_8G260600v2 [Setaria viridis]